MPEEDAMKPTLVNCVRRLLEKSATVWQEAMTAQLPVEMWTVLSFVPDDRLRVIIFFFLDYT